MRDFIFDYPAHLFGNSLLVNADCLEWLSKLPENSIHGVVTDPPYGIKEYNQEQLEKRTNGKGGVWRGPPSFDGAKRAPLPRFTSLNQNERKYLHTFFKDWSHALLKPLAPGSYVFVASNSFISQLTFQAITEGGLEFRGELIRLVRTLRGGDKPKNAEKEFPTVCSMPRACFEPWGIFRKPLQGMKISDCLREFGTGGLRRMPNGNPFCDVIHNERTPKKERKVANHPSLKPQSFLRQLVYAALPLGQGILVDPFAGSGSTVAASEALGLTCIGVERSVEYFNLSIKAVPLLTKFT